MRHVFCLSVMVRFSHNSFDNSLSTLEFLSHLCSSCILFAKSLRLRFMSFLKMCFPLVSNGGFVWHFLHRVPPIFLKVVWVEFACACGALVALWSWLCPILARWLACSLVFILAWARALCIVVSCVRECNNWTMDSRRVLSWWLLCRVWCLICVVSMYRASRLFVKMRASSFWYFGSEYLEDVVYGHHFRAYYIS